jgi:hypothetical protein
MASVTEPRAPHLLPLPLQVLRTTKVTIGMDHMGRLNRASLIKDSAVPRERRLRQRDARRNALVRQNVAVVRLVEKIRSLTSFSF